MRQHALPTWVVGANVSEAMGSTEREDRRRGGQADPVPVTRREAQRSNGAREPESRWRYTSAIEAARALGASRIGLVAGAS
jgi:hypothetical protein